MQNVDPPPTPPFLANVHVLRPSEPEKMVFANVSVCLSVCLSVCRFYFVMTVWIGLWHPFLVSRNEGQVR